MHANLFIVDTPSAKSGFIPGFARREHVSEDRQVVRTSIDGAAARLLPWLLACFTALAPAIGAQEPVAATILTLEPTPLQLPRRIGPLVADAEPHRFEDPSLGVGYQYRAAGLMLSLYVYDLGVRDIGDGPETAEACLQFEQAKGDVMQAGYADARIVAERLVKLLPGEDSPQVREAIFEFAVHGRSTSSYLWVTGVAGRFLKLRFSADAQLRDEMPEARRAILTALGEALAPHIHRRAADSSEQSSITLQPPTGASARDDELGFLYTAALSAKAGQSPSLRPVCGGELEPSFDVEREIWRELRAAGLAADSGFASQLGKAEAAGFLDEFIWTELHRPAWGKAPGELKLEEYTRWKSRNLRRLRVPSLGEVIIHRPRPLPVESLDAP
jgi:hypothetical protein